MGELISKMNIDYRSRLLVPIANGSADIIFETKSGMAVANGCSRVVFGDRGPYVEFTETQIIRESIMIPFKQRWRLGGELRTD